MSSLNQMQQNGMVARKDGGKRSELLLIQKREHGRVNDIKGTIGISLFNNTRDVNFART